MKVTSNIGKVSPNVLSSTKEVVLKRLKDGRAYIADEVLTGADERASEMFKNALAENLSKIYPEYASEDDEDDPTLEVIVEFLRQHRSPIARKMVAYYHKLRPHTQSSIEYYYKAAMLGDHSARLELASLFSQKKLENCKKEIQIVGEAFYAQNLWTEHQKGEVDRKQVEKIKQLAEQLDTPSYIEKIKRLKEKAPTTKPTPGLTSAISPRSKEFLGKLQSSSESQSSPDPIEEVMKDTSAEELLERATVIESPLSPVLSDPAIKELGRRIKVLVEQQEQAAVARKAKTIQENKDRLNQKDKLSKTKKTTTKKTKRSNNKKTTTK